MGTYITKLNGYGKNLIGGILFKAHSDCFWYHQIKTLVSLSSLGFIDNLCVVIDNLTFKVS